MHLLPLNLGALAPLVGDVGRHSLSGVHLTVSDTGYVAEVTDGKVLLRVAGDNPPGKDDYPAIPSLASAPDDATDAVIPAKQWQGAFRDAAKLKLRRTSKPILRNVAVAIGRDTTTLASTDCDRNNLATSQNLAGRYPDCVHTIDDAGKNVKVRIAVDPARFARLLEAASNFIEDGASVTLDISDATHPIVLRAANAAGQSLIGLLMPMTPPKT